MLLTLERNLKKFVICLKDSRMIYTKLAAKSEEKCDLIIKCQRKEYNLYRGTVNNKLDDVRLASKGWSHNKSRGDYFTICTNHNEFDKPRTAFQELDLNTKLIETLSTQNIYKATQFQTEAIPVIKSGKHVLIAAETGCGKTLAYMLPIIQNLIGLKSSEMNTPKALILVPNRELAVQVGEVAKMLADNVDLKVKVVVGGHTKKLMMYPDFSNIDILVGTPGAIGKLSTVGIYKLNKVLHTILDEADSLLDDTFADRLSSLLKRVPQSQIILSSATLPKKIPDFLEPIEPTLVVIKSARLHKPLLNVTQKFIRLSGSAKPSQILQIAKNSRAPLLIFTNRNETCNWLAMFLRENKLKCANINGDMNYDIRKIQFNNFISGQVNILSSTDVGSRGLDFIQVEHVVNYDFPLYAAEYIHRVGRTGRLGSSLNSKITNFISGVQEITLVQQIELAIRTNTPIPNVDGNIHAIVRNKILKRIRESS